MLEIKKIKFLDSQERFSKIFGIMPRNSRNVP